MVEQALPDLLDHSPMTAARSERRQEFLQRFCAALSDALGPRLDVEVVSSRAVATRLDQGRGGTKVTVIALLPRLTLRSDLIGSAKRTVTAVHRSVTDSDAFACSPIGDAQPQVTVSGNNVVVQFLAPDGRAAPGFTVPLQQS